MGERKISPLYRLIKAAVRAVYPKIKVVGEENLPPEPVVYVGNHSQMNGPIACELYTPGEHYIWCAGEMMDKKEVPAYAYQDFWSEKPKAVRWFYKLLSYIIAPLSQLVFTNANTIGVKNIIAIPHLGASTPESEDNCAMMAADELSAYLEQGNIINSVNFPNAEMHANGTKLCVLHKNVPTIIAQITSALGDAGKNIDNMVNASKKDNAYTMIDVAGDVADSIVDTVKAIDGVIRVRVIA